MLVLLFLMAMPLDPPAKGDTRPQAPKATITLRDTRGRITGTFVPGNGSLAIRDAQGRLTGSVTLRGNQATIKDSRGRATATGGKNGKR